MHLVRMSPERRVVVITVCRYSSIFVKAYIEASKPRLAIGEYWDTCRYTGPKYTLDYNQGSHFSKITYLYG